MPHSAYSPRFFACAALTLLLAVAPGCSEKRSVAPPAGDSEATSTSDAANASDSGEPSGAGDSGEASGSAPASEPDNTSADSGA